MGNKHILTTQFYAQLLTAIGHPLVLLVCILLILNWGIEAWKWKILASNIEPTTFYQALSGVFTGVCFGFITPHGIGDYAGRILQLQTNERLQALGAVFVSRIAQLFVTLIAGSGVLIYMIYNEQISTSALINHTLMTFVLLTNIALVLVFFYYKQIVQLIKNKYTKPFVKIIAQTHSRQMWGILLLSALRYGVFATQYMLLLYDAGITCPIATLAAGVAFVFIVKSIIPTFFDIGIREAAAIYFFSAYAASADSIVFASVLLWLINIVLPSIVGALMIFRIRLLA